MSFVRLLFDKFRTHSGRWLFVIGLLLLLLMIWMAGPGELWNNLLRMRWMLFAIVAVWGVGYCLNACSWLAIIRCYPMSGTLSYGRLFGYTVTGFAINYITPFGLLGGEPYRVVKMRHYLGVEAATSSVVLYMMMHICSHFVFWLIACGMAVFAIAHIPLSLAVALSAVSMLCLAGILIFFKGYRAGMVERLVKQLCRMPWLSNRLQPWYERMSGQIQQIDLGITNLLLHHPKSFYASLAVEWLSRMVNCWEIWLIMWVLGYQVSYVDSVLVVAFSSLFANLLFFSPLQMATREGGILLALQMILPELSMAYLMPLAVSVSMMTRLREFVWISIGLCCVKQKKIKQL